VKDFLGLSAEEMAHIEIKSLLALGASKEDLAQAIASGVGVKA
jgi:hypothetical protein